MLTYQSRHEEVALGKNCLKSKTMCNTCSKC